MQARRNVVIVRAGDNSLHAGWLGENRNWDLVVSWYGDTVYTPIADETVIAIKGGLGDGIYKTFEVLPGLIERYDYFWLPDDDIEADCASINRLFEIAAQQGLELSQPALSHDSYFTYPHTLVSSSFLLRYSALVEVMVPCLSRRKMREVLPMFVDNPSLYGVDLIWARLEADNRDKAAIIDAVTVRHTRPVGGLLAGLLQGGRNDPVDARQRVLDRFRLSGVDRGFACYGGLARGDTRRRGAISTRLHMLVDYMGNIGHWRQKGAFWAILRKFRRRTQSLTQVQPIGEDATAR